MLKNLLVPLDGSPLAEHALPYAAALARTFRARLTVFHAQTIDVPSEQPPPDLEAVAARLHADGIATDTHVYHLSTSRDVGEVILEAAADLRIDLIVMATHGRGGLGRMIYGSVADQVIRRTTLPVLLIPPMCDRRWADDRPTRILVPLDGSEVAEAILAPLRIMVKMAGAELILLRVAETIETRPHGDECVRCRLARARGEEPDIEQVRARHYVDDIADQLLAEGIVAQAQVEIGGAPQIISKAAREQDIDLIAMATHGRGGLARLVLGSVATETVRQAHVPVLLVRPTEMRQAAPMGATSTPAVTPADTPATGAREEPVRARDIMSQPVVTVGLDATLEEVARLMLDRGIGGVPVVDADGHIIGIVTETDFSGKGGYVPFSSIKEPRLFGEWMPKSGVEAIFRAARTMKAKDIMSAPATVAVEEEPVAALIRRMIEHEVSRLPVVRGPVPVGMVTRHDLLRLMERDVSGR